MDLASLPAWVSDAGPAAGVCLLVVIFIMRGWLVPKATVTMLVAAERTRADEHRATAQAAEQLAQQLAAQNATLLAQGETNIALLRSIREWQARERRDGS
jgi:hypothetical protein